MRRASLFLLFFLGSCGYQWIPNLPDGQIPTVVIPYALGDDDGTFTGELIRTLTASGIANVQPLEASYLLKVDLVDGSNKTVGFRKSKQKVSGKVSKNLVATEGRRQLSARVTLYKKDSNTIVKGPYLITATADYDYIDGDSIQDLAFSNSRGERTTALAFSLGQLEPIDSAQEAASRPLHERLAKKITDTIFSAL